MGKEERALRGTNITSFLEVPQVTVSDLETEASTELSLERNSEWLREASCAKEVVGLAKIRRARRVLELITIVSGVENIERFEEQAELIFLAPLEELRNAHVQL